MSPPLEHVFRDEWGRVLATLIGLLGDFDLAEEAAQEEARAALARALELAGAEAERRLLERRLARLVSG